MWWSSKTISYPSWGSDRCGQVGTASKVPESLPAVVFLPTRLPPLPSSDMIKKVSCSLVKEIGLRGWRSASIRERIMCTAITNIWAWLYILSHLTRKYHLWAREPVTYPTSCSLNWSILWTRLDRRFVNVSSLSKRLDDWRARGGGDWNILCKDINTTDVIKTIGRWLTRCRGPPNPAQLLVSNQPS